MMALQDAFIVFALHSDYLGCYILVNINRYIWYSELENQNLTYILKHHIHLIQKRHNNIQIY